MLSNASVGLAVTTPDGVVLSANPTFNKLIGFAKGECDGRPLEEFACLEARDELRTYIAQATKRRRGIAKPIEVRLQRKGGGGLWGRIAITALRDDGAAKAEHLVVELAGIEEQKAAEKASSINVTRMNYALESAGQGVWDFDFNTRETFYSKTWRALRGFSEDEEIDGSQEVWLARVHPDDRERIRAMMPDVSDPTKQHNSYEYRERRRDGKWIWIMSRGQIHDWNPDGTPARIIGIDTDITKLKEDEARNAKEAERTFRKNLSVLRKAQEAAEVAQQYALSLARHDTLTGLANRRVFAEALENAIAEVKASAGPRAIMIVDLDRFKPINDLYGHAAGDAVLCEVAKRLSEVVRGGDSVARFGGDEFAVVCESPPDGKGIEGSAARIARRIIKAIERPIPCADTMVEISASVGVAICPADGETADALFHKADMAMYRAKQRGRGSFCFYDVSMEAELLDQAELEADVREAVSKGQIEPHYQPLVMLSGNQVVGFEVLARWHHPVRGNVAPDVFIPVIERLGLMASFTYAILRRACREARDWPGQVSIALNVAPAHLSDPLLPTRILSILSETDFSPKRLEIEVTEQAVTNDLEAAQRTVATLQSLGIRVSLDDFGIGYSNLSNLREFHFDKIKIDRSFVQSMKDNVENARLVRSIIGLAKNLGLPTVAEGIEHIDALRNIIEGGGEFGQGYYFAKALPASEALALLRKSPNADSTKSVA